MENYKKELVERKLRLSKEAEKKDKKLREMRNKIEKSNKESTETISQMDSEIIELEERYNRIMKQKNSPITRYTNTMSLTTKSASLPTKPRDGKPNAYSSTYPTRKVQFRQDESGVREEIE